MITIAKRRHGVDSTGTGTRPNCPKLSGWGRIKLVNPPERASRRGKAGSSACAAGCTGRHERDIVSGAVESSKVNAVDGNGQNDPARAPVRYGR